MKARFNELAAEYFEREDELLWRDIEECTEVESGMRSEGVQGVGTVRHGLDECRGDKVGFFDELAGAAGVAKDAFGREVAAVWRAGIATEIVQHAPMGRVGSASAGLVQATGGTRGQMGGLGRRIQEGYGGYGSA